MNKTYDQIEYKRKVERYCNNLNEKALTMLCIQLILYPETIEYVTNAIEENWEAFTFPLGKLREFSHTDVEEE